MLLLTLRGTPTLYYGDEIGMTDVPIAPEQQRDPWGKRVPGLGRDPCRTPMQWRPTHNAGFASPDVAELWLPLAADYPERNVECQSKDPGSLLNFYRVLLSFRRGSAALQQGSYRAVDHVPEDCYVFLRETDDQRLLVALNLSAESRSLMLPEFGRGEVVISTRLDSSGQVDLGALVLRGSEGVIIERSA
jgi:alpha-glucosidase